MNVDTAIIMDRVKRELNARAVSQAIMTGLNIQPTKRMGKVTADGAVFEMSDPRYVGKLLFYKTPKNVAQIDKEFRIGKKLGQLGIAPKVYSKKYVKFRGTEYLPKNLLLNRNMISNEAYFIIMENLAYGALKLESLWDYVQRVKVYPSRQVENLYRKLVDNRIIHGDLHAGNIMVKTLQSGRIKLYLIDFTRSVEGVTSSNYLKGRKGLSNYPGYYYVNSNVVGNNAAILNRNFKTLGKPSNKKPVQTVSIPKNFFGKESPKKLNSNFFKGLEC